MAAPALITAADRPVRAAGVTLHRRSDDGAALLERRGRYMQLSAAAAAIWHWCDGEHGVDTIALRYHQRFGIDGSAAVAELLDQWSRAGLVAMRPLDADATSAPQGTMHVRRSGASVYVTWSVERWSGRAYAIARSVFAPPVLAALAAISIAGTALAVLAGNWPAPGGAVQTVAYAAAFVLAVIIHEAGHALTLARFGGIVRACGIGWYWCAPIAFVDTSDAYSLPRGQRIWVSLAGPISSFVFASFATIVASCALPDGLRSLAWAVAIMNYGVSLWNLNPLIELDGYYILTDLLDRPNLRSDAFRALRERRASRIELAYVAGVIIYAAIAIPLMLETVIPRLAIAVHALIAR